jgi:hypothetical protein
MVTRGPVHSVLQSIAQVKHAGVSLSTKDSCCALLPFIGFDVLSIRRLMSSEAESIPADQKQSKREASVRYAQERKAYEMKISEARRKWYKELELKRTSDGEELSRLRAAREAKRADKAAQRLAGKEGDATDAVTRIEMQNKALKESKRVDSIARENARRDVLGKLRKERERVLLEQSRYWIGTEEELDAAVDAAIENPEPLWVSEKVQK